MKKPQFGRGHGGFTLIEMLVVMALMIILLLFAVPVLQTSMRQGKIRGIAAQTATVMRLARLEAIKRSCASVVRIVDAAGRNPAHVEGFPDCDGDGVADADKPALGSFPLPNGVRFLAPPNLEGEDSVDDFSADPGGDDANVAIFLPDGSIETTGGFRFGDDAGNFLEVRVSPQATARIEVRKCRVCADATLDSDWYAAGQGGEAWQWK